ncbi:hypothetical protein GGI08_001778, partial [Coemansia sp. S2]
MSSGNICIFKQDHRLDVTVPKGTSFKEVEAKAKEGYKDRGITEDTHIYYATFENLSKNNRIKNDD